MGRDKEEFVPASDYKPPKVRPQQEREPEMEESEPSTDAEFKAFLKWKGQQEKPQQKEPPGYIEREEKQDFIWENRHALFLGLVGFVLVLVLISYYLIYSACIVR